MVIYKWKEERKEEGFKEWNQCREKTEAVPVLMTPLAKNAENSLSKKLPRRLRDGRERERGRDRENEG